MPKGYREISEHELPQGLRWDTPRAWAGQAVTVEYAEPGNPAGPNEDGAMYMRRKDASLSRDVRYYHREAYA